MQINKIYNGDCLEILRTFEDNCVDSVVTDPPYGLSFMGKHWDYDVPTVEIWKECLRVLKPGGHLLSFAGTRTYHRMAVNIEDAGFEIRDMIAWVYGSGFPKSLDVSKAIDKMAGAERKQILIPTKLGNLPEQAGAISLGATGMTDISEPITESAKQWSGWGTALKPALEPICVARKPLIGTVAENVLKYGTGAMNIDGCRLDVPGRKTGTVNPEAKSGSGNCYRGSDGKKQMEYDLQNLGRWPANLIHDGSEEVVGMFPNVGNGNNGVPYNYCGRQYSNKNTSMFNGDKPNSNSNFNDYGSAARFFKCCKFNSEDESWPQKQKNDQNVRCVENLSGLCETPIAEEVAETKTSDLNQGESQVIRDSIGNYKECIQPPSRALFAENQENTGTIPTTPIRLKLSGCANRAIINSTLEIEKSESKRFLYCPKASKEDRGDGNNHCTVKPTDLMRYLCRLVTPPNGIILDPFFGSGSTGKAAKLEFFNYIGIEREKEYCEIATKRIENTLVNKRLEFG